MAELLRMPEVAANAVEAVLHEWPVAENIAYAASDVIATVETEKAVVDVEAESGGVILRTLVTAGSAVDVGAPIAVLGAVGESVEDVDSLLAQLGVAAPEPKAAPTRREVPNELRANGQVNGTRIFASPLARRLARDADIAVEDISGTGPGGRIVRRDVEAAIARRVSVGTTPTSADLHAVAPEPPSSAQLEGASYVDTAHSRMRRAVATRLGESKQTIPHFYLRGSAQVDKLMKLRAQLNAGTGTKISINDLVIKAAAHALVAVPAMNVGWTADALRSFSVVDISVAIATDRGLVTPVLRGVDRLPVSAVAATVKDFSARAGDGRLRQSELEGGSFSISNLGMYGTEEFAAIINPPQSAILAVGAAVQAPVVRKGKLRVGTVMRVTLSVDHRPIDGAVAAEWMRTFLALLESPVQILA